MRSKWIKTETARPTKNGKYWVYPYYGIEGGKFVTLARFENGDWEDKKQHYSYWQKVDVPAPPRMRD